MVGDLVLPDQGDDQRRLDGEKDRLGPVDLGDHLRGPLGARPQEEPPRRAAAAEQQRSEEHTPELQSLMRISYAVFCLKKNTTQNNSHHTIIKRNRLPTPNSQ